MAEQEAGRRLAAAHNIQQYVTVIRSPAERPRHMLSLVSAGILTSS
jgi:hypothetical protein